MRGNVLTLGICYVLAYITASLSPVDIDTVDPAPDVAKTAVDAVAQSESPDVTEGDTDASDEPDDAQETTDGEHEGVPDAEPVCESISEVDENEILSVDGEVRSPQDEQFESPEPVSDVPDDELPAVGPQETASVTMLGARYCTWCSVAERALDYAEQQNSTWTHGPEASNVFRTLDVERDPDGRQLWIESGKPNLPSFIIERRDGTKAIVVGWGGGNPESQQAMDFLTSFYGISSGDTGNVPTSRERRDRTRRRRLGEALADHLQGRPVDTFYDAEFDMGKVVSKLMGGQKSVQVSDGLTLSMDSLPTLKLGSYGTDTRLEFSRGPPTLAYRKGLIRVSAAVPYVLFNPSVSKVTVGLDGLPDFPVYLNW